LRALCILLRSLVRHRGGVTGLEYAIIAAMIAVAVVPAAVTVGKQLAGLMQDAGATLAGVPLKDSDRP
jgi:Flp pilus assembly pilin Flp